MFNNSQAYINGTSLSTMADIRVCHYCREEIGEEYHHLITCSDLKKYVESKFWKRQSALMLKKHYSNSANIQKIMCS